MKSTSPGTGVRIDASTALLFACLLVCALFVYASYGMEEASSYLLPRLLGIAGIVAAAIALGGGFLAPRVPAGSDERRGVSVLVSIAFATAYFLLVPLLGFVLATATAIVAFSYVMSFPRKRLVAALAVVVPLALHLAFSRLLNAPLPTGLGGALPF